MSVSKIHGLYAVVLNTTPTATTIGGITQQGMPLGTEVRGEPRSGEEYARILSIIAQNPRVNFSTGELATALGECALSGHDLGTDALDLYAQKFAEGGSRASGSVHTKFTINEGILVPRRLSCDHQGDAALNYEAVITYDGSNDPVVITASQALPSASTAKERFTIGPVTIESITLDQVKSLEIDFGIEVVAEGGDSDVWPTMAFIRQTQPTITLRGIDADWFSASEVPLAGLAATHANTTVYLKKRAEGGTFVANGTAEHIKFTAAGLAYVDDGFSASGNDPGEVSIIIPCYYDGSNAPITVDTASAIT